ncbi:hypothetical protein [Mangrovibacillus cuniculi]|uniref:DUF4440 domain-containing protein n=1 Tax=Mangrovibacillus cuniculi TaxID=2593652 RepID=A0A7S8CCL3_9BACI|nr:hypothetical protein [Mangrovibacillus cuniculi]QPC47522.1 hypothetical protein G8O30_11465 [Mangrovibacillus cuniculi]
MKSLLVAGASVVMAISLYGCQSKEDTSAVKPVTQEQANQEPRELTEAKNISDVDKQAVIQTLEAQEAAFNAKDIDAYMETISKDPLSFDYNEERDFVQSMFKAYDMTMDMETKTIIEYNEAEQTATVHIRTKTSVKEAGNESMEPLEDLSNQVVMLRKEDNEWNIIQTFAMEQREQ